MELPPSMRALANYPHGSQPEESRPRGTCSISALKSALRLRLRVYCVGVGVVGWLARQMHARSFGTHTRLHAHTAFKANCEMKNPQDETGDR